MVYLHAIERICFHLGLRSLAFYPFFALFSLSASLLLFHFLLHMKVHGRRKRWRVDRGDGSDHLGPAFYLRGAARDRDPDHRRGGADD
jgi:hypothetical protein